MITAILLYHNSRTPADPATTALIIGIVGGVMAVAGAILRDRRTRLLKTGIKVEGTVFSIEYEPRYGKDSGDIYYPIIRYVTLTGEWITKKHTFGSKPCVFTEGESVTVFYDPKDPSTFILNDKLSKTAPWLMILFGIILTIGATIAYILL